MRAYAGLCGPMRANAGLCGPMRAYAGLCGSGRWRRVNRQRAMKSEKKSENKSLLGSPRSKTGTRNSNCSEFKGHIVDGCEESLQWKRTGNRTGNRTGKSTGNRTRNRTRNRIALLIALLLVAFSKRNVA